MREMHLRHYLVLQTLRSVYYSQHIMRRYVLKWEGSSDRVTTKTHGEAQIGCFFMVIMLEGCVAVAINSFCNK
jgi:hypothetical protein